MSLNWCLCRHGNYCSWCSNEILPDETIVNCDIEHREWLTNLLHNWLPIKQASEDITTVIIGLFITDQWAMQLFHKSCLDFNCHTTRSGRKTLM